MSCGGALSALNLIATSGILTNTALSPSSLLTGATSAFNSLAVTSQFSNIVTSATGALSAGTLTSLRTLGAGTFPAVTNAIPGGFYDQFQTTTFNGGFTGFLDGVGSSIMGNGDLSKFAQTFQSGQGFAAQANGFVNSVLNTGAISNTFSSSLGGMDNLITGSVSQVSEAFGSFGSDLARTGSLINLDNLSNLGNPSALLSNLSSAGGLTPAVQGALRSAGLSDLQLSSLNVPGSFPAVSDSANKFFYDAMTRVSGPALDEVKQILGVTTPGINTMADLLDPQRILPNSWPSLTTPTPNGLRGIYRPDGSVNSNLTSLLSANDRPAARTTTPGAWDWATTGQAGQDRFGLYTSRTETVAGDAGTTTRFVG